MWPSDCAFIPVVFTFRSLGHIPAGINQHYSIHVNTNVLFMPPKDLVRGPSRWDPIVNCHKKNERLLNPTGI